MDLLVKGLRIEDYFKVTCSDKEPFFTYDEELDDEYIFFCIHEKTNKKYKIMVDKGEGENRDGYCVAKWAYIDMEEICAFEEFMYKPIKDLYFKNFNPNTREYHNEFLNYSYNGKRGIYTKRRIQCENGVI